MLDLHALTDGGSVTLKNISLAADIPALDGQTAPGVPIAPGAVLKCWGAMTTIADTLMELKLISQDQVDSINGEYWNPGAACVLGLQNFDTLLPYSKGGRNISIRQNTGAANIVAYTIDKYPTPVGANVQNFVNMIKISQVFGGALTAVTWGSVAFAPASNIPAGTYGLLGVYVSALTNYALIRFRHADFGGKIPGFPVVDKTKAAARAVVPMGTPIFNMDGFQFLALGDIPIFRVTSAGTGLTIDMLSITADTPNVCMNLVQLA
jgi:hypothetical protein